MATSTGVKYIGKNDVYEDNILRTGLTWSKGETHILPEVMAKEFLKHPGMFAEVPGASYLIASSSAPGVRVFGDQEIPARTRSGAEWPVDVKSPVAEANRREKTWLCRPAALSSWTYKAFPGTSMTALSGGAMKFRTVTGNYATAYHDLVAGLCPEELIVYLDSPDFSRITSISVTLTDAAGTTGWTWTWAYTSDIAFYGSGIRALRMTKASYKTLVGAGDFATTSVAKLAITHSPINAGDQSELWFYGLEKNPVRANKRATISIGADDCLARWYTAGLPVLQAYGIYNSYQAVIYDQLDKPGFQTKAQVSTFVDAGGECIVHGPRGTYDAATGDLSMYSTFDDVRADLEFNRDGLVAEGWATNGSEQIYVFPRSVYQKAAGDDTIYRAVRAAGFKAARITAGGTFCRDRLDAHTGYGVRILGHTWSATDETANIAAIIAAIADGVAKGFDMCLMFHDVTTAPASATEITAVNLALICAEIAKHNALGNLDVLKPTEQWLAFVRDSQF